MGEMAEDRIYAERRGKTDVYVGADMGLTLVAISDDRVGRFRLVRRGAVRSVAAAGSVLLATDEDVYRGEPGGETFERLGFGAAVAVGFDGDPVAAGTDGTIARYVEDEWVGLGTAEDPRAIAGGWLAAADGAYRIQEEGLERTGLADVRDVTDGDRPLAATAKGLYRLEDDAWDRERAGTGSVVATDGTRAHAVLDGRLLEREDGGWRPRALPLAERVVDVGYTRSPVAVTESGTVLVDPAAAKDGAEGWRRRSLGLSGVTGLATATVPADRKRV